MSVFKISPRYDSSKLNPGTFDDRLDVYEDRVRGWLIDCGRILNRNEHAGFGVLQTALAKSVVLKYTPHLVFHLDDSIERGARVFEILQQIETPAAESE